MSDEGPDESLVESIVESIIADVVGSTDSLAAAADGLADPATGTGDFFDLESIEPPDIVFDASADDALGISPDDFTDILLGNNDEEGE